MNNPQTPGKRRIVKWVGILVLAAIALHGLNWWLLSRQAELLLQVWLDERRAEGFEISHTQLSVGGYPFEVTLTAQTLEIKRSLPQGVWATNSEGITARSKLMSPNVIKITTQSSDALWPRFGRIEAGKLEAGPAHIDLNIVDGQPKTVNLLIGDLLFTGANGRVATTETLDLKLKQPTLPAVVEISIDARKTILPEQANSPLGTSVARFQMTAQLNGAVSPGTLRSILSEWQGNGGTIEVGTLTFDHGPLSLTGNGTLSLDQSLQPVGAFSAKVQGFRPTLSALTQQSLINERDAALASIVLGALAKPSPSNGKPTLDLPITLQQQTLSVGPFNLMKLKAFIWE